MWAKNGVEAVDIASKEIVDLILMDIKMLVMNGIDALCEIQKIYVDLPVIVQSAYAFDTDKIVVKQAASTDFITQPISASQLNKLIKKYLSL